MYIVLLGACFMQVTSYVAYICAYMSYMHVRYLAFLCMAVLNYYFRVHRGSASCFVIVMCITCTVIHNVCLLVSLVFTHLGDIEGMM